MNKKTLLIILAAAVAVCVGLCLIFSSPSKPIREGDLLRNGSFDQVDEDGMPVSWYTDAYVYQGYTDYELSEGRSGQAAHIVNRYANDARFAQSVQVSPDTVYHLHGYIRADANGGLGANLSIEGIYVFSDCVYSTNGEWQEVSLYGRTGKDQTGVTVYARLGGYSGEAEGEAWFDDVTLCEVREEDIPADYIMTLWYQPAYDDYSDTDGESSTGALTLVLSCLFYAAIFALLSGIVKNEKITLGRENNGEKAALILILLVGLVSRLFTAFRVPGYDVDIGCFQSWAAQMANVGPGTFYAQGFCDYTPGYLWVLGGLGWIGKLTGGVTEWLVKMPAIVCDLALCVLLYAEGKKRTDGKRALAVCTLYAFNPLTFAAGAAWGQVDSVMTLLLFLCVLFALRESWGAALPLYMAAVLVKPQALMFGPLGLTAFVCFLVKGWKTPENRKATLRKAALGLGCTAAVFLLIVLPFTGDQQPGWLMSLYSSTMSEYGYATVNACNLYFLFGQNWAVTDSVSPGLPISVCAWLICVLPCLLALLPDWRPLLKNEKSLPAAWKKLTAGQKRYTLFTLCLCLLLALIPALLRVMGLYRYNVLQIAVILFALLMTGLYFVREGDIRNLPGLGAALLMLLFACGPMMHERYLFPAAALLFLAAIVKKRKEFLYLAILVSLAGFLNVGCALDRNIRIGGAEGHLDTPLYGIDSDMKGLEYLSALLNCLGAMLTLSVSLILSRADLCEKRDQEKAAEVSAALVHPAAPVLPQYQDLPRMRRWDVIVMLTVTLLYACLAFTHLGSLKAPQSGYRAMASEEETVLDLCEETEFEVFYFGGIHQYDMTFSLETSVDGEIWQNYVSCDMAIGDCFKWLSAGNPYSAAPFRGRYVRLIADQPGLTLYELLFRNAETKEPLSAVILSNSMENETAALLTDENDTMEGDPGWFNSTYFDEIYHARTGFEHLHGLPPYETTHPPLGKVLIGLCIGVFGMTPFGWRFAGALAGVLMLPAMYLLGKLLFRRKWGGFLSMMLMALDLMHFAQTRIATIDSFVVLFILYSVYFMLRWFMTDPFTGKFSKTLIPLALSGFFMGLSVASKWTGCFNGLGLGVIFFFGIFRHFREIRAAQEVPENKRTPRQQRAALGAKGQLLTILSCLVFFVAVPLCIYYVSYIPYFAYNGGVTVKKVIEAAVGTYFTNGQVGGMLGYHNTPGFGSDHPFNSPWYEWPVIAKPMWYSSASARGGMSSTIMAMGNPAIWWLGLIALFAVMVLWVKRHIDKNGAVSLYAKEDDPRCALLLICFLAQFLPWTQVTRGTYIYHYFPCVGFIILCLGYCLEKLGNRWRKAETVGAAALLILALVCFIFFFPYASGITVSVKWLEAAKRLFPFPIWY